MTGDLGSTRAAVRYLFDLLMGCVSGVDGEPVWESRQELLEDLDEPHRMTIAQLVEVQTYAGDPAIAEQLPGPSRSVDP